MIELSNQVEQTLAVGQSAVFGTTILKTGCNESHRRGSGLVTVRCGGVYEVSFSGNVSGTAAGPVQLAIALDGEALPETTMISTVGVAGDLNSVSASTLARIPCGCCVTLSVKNTGTVPVVIGANPSFSVRRVA